MDREERGVGHLVHDSPAYPVDHHMGFQVLEQASQEAVIFPLKILDHRQYVWELLPEPTLQRRLMAVRAEQHLEEVSLRIMFGPAILGIDQGIVELPLLTQPNK